MDERTETMRENGVYWCPDWCTQDPDEHQHEQHVGDWRTLTTSTGDIIAVRPRMSWWDDPAADHVEITLTVADAPDGLGAWLTMHESNQLQDLIVDAQGDCDFHRTYIDFSRRIEAYPGADDDENGADEAEEADEDEDEDEEDEEPDDED